jgi:hypothetical protein
MRLLSPVLPALSVLFLVACGGAAPPPVTPPGPTAAPAQTAPPPVVSSACPGKVEVADGLQEVSDGTLLEQALGAPGKGSLCTGKVFQVVKPVTVYRVWNKAKAYTQLGRWWSFSTPRGPADDYRRANDICPEWSALDVVSECKLKVGARVVVGPGQSATCEKGALPASATNQVFVPNETKDPANQKVFVEGCTPGAAWP